MFKNIKINKPLLLIFGAVLLCIFPLFKMEYATDTYVAEALSLGHITEVMFQNGRLITGLFTLLFYHFSWSLEAFYYTSFILSIIFMTLAIYTLYTILDGHMQNWLCLFIAFITVFNPCAIEYFLFIEKGPFTFSILMAILSVKCFVLFLHGKRMLLIPSFLLLALSALTYQIIPGAFVVIAVVFIVKYSKSLKEFLINNALAASIYGCGTLIDFLYIKLTQANDRVGSKIYISNIFKFYSFKTNSPLFILLYLSIFVASLGIFLFVCWHKNKKKPGKSDYLTYLKYFYLIIATLAVTVIPFVFTNPNEVWIMFRVAYPLGTLFGAILIMFFYRNSYECATKKISTGLKCFRSAMIILLTAEIVFFHALTFSRIINNQADEKLCFQIYEEIQAYENETGTEITKISIYYDSSLTHKNPHVLLIGDCNVRAFSRSWSDVNHISALTGRHFKKVDGKAEYSKHFKEQAWDSYSPEQLIFDGDTLHLCVY